ncbi:hypothetical protein PVAP13_2NG143809 [Panicum virgatum]|uniref:Uncharacterized protein n=1 Tax=Panicum virgatum TaxID=38727 RepID=A0A8T0V9P8_PANVG|nr:hypothetical protein PVAP13_2NG143809 [Panicum virgatum]
MANTPASRSPSVHPPPSPIQNLAGKFWRASGSSDSESDVEDLGDVETNGKSILIPSAPPMNTSDASTGWTEVKKKAQKKSLAPKWPWNKSSWRGPLSKPRQSPQRTLGDFLQPAMSSRGDASSKSAGKRSRPAPPKSSSPGARVRVADQLGRNIADGLSQAGPQEPIRPNQKEPSRARQQASVLPSLPKQKLSCAATVAETFRSKLFRSKPKTYLEAASMAGGGGMRAGGSGGGRGPTGSKNGVSRGYRGPFRPQGRGGGRGRGRSSSPANDLGGREPERGRGGQHGGGTDRGRTDVPPSPQRDAVPVPKQGATTTDATRLTQNQDTGDKKHKGSALVHCVQKNITRLYSEGHTDCSSGRSCNRQEHRSYSDL